MLVLVLLALLLLVVKVQPVVIAAVKQQVKARWL